MSEHEQMPIRDKEIYRRIDEIAHYVWDPIGVSLIPAARDEYRAYITGIYGRVMQGSYDDLIEFLKHAATESMGLSYDMEKTEAAARAMLDAKEHILGAS